MGLGRTGLERDGAAEVAHRLLGLPRVPQGVAQIVVRHAVIGPQRQGATIGGDRLVEPARLAQDDAQVVVSLGGIRPELDDSPEGGDRLGQPAGPMMLEGDLRCLFDRDRRHWPHPLPLSSPQPMVEKESVNLSPLTKGGCKGVLERRDPEDLGLEFTPPAPPS